MKSTMKPNNIYNKYFSEKVLVVKNPNRKTKADQYNIRVLPLDDVLKLIGMIELQKENE